VLDVTLSVTNALQAGTLELEPGQRMQDVLGARLHQANGEGVRLMWIPV
jgi:hypothetical protein